MGLGGGTALAAGTVTTRLLQAKAHVNALDRRRETPLMRACRAGPMCFEAAEKCTQLPQLTAVERAGRGESECVAGRESTSTLWLTRMPFGS